MRIILVSLILILQISHIISTLELVGPPSIARKNPFQYPLDKDGKEVQINKLPLYCKSIKNNTIQYVLGNFGDVPYGKTLYGSLIKGYPFDGCSPLEHEELKTSEVYKNEIVLLALAYIFLERGHCDFTLMVEHAQKAGAKLAIIMDYHVDHDEYVIMADDGYGDIINIPSIFIDHSDGDKLIKLMEQVEEEYKTNPLNKYVQLKIDFNIVKTDIVDYKFYLYIPYRESYVFIHNFNQYRSNYMQRLKNKSTFEPIYLVLYCEDCGPNWNTSLSNCLGGGRYCLYNPDNNGGTGQDILYEIIRARCIYTELGDDYWFDYTSNFYHVCLNARDYKDCWKKLIKLPKEIEQVETCSKNSFDSKSNSKLEFQQNFILDDMQQKGANSFIASWPGAVINGFPYRGNMESEDLSEALCASQKTMTSACEYKMNGQMDDTSAKDKDKTGKVEQKVNKPIGDSKSDSDDSSTTIVIIICVSIAVITLAGIGIFLWYRRIVRREQASSQVNELIANYVEFYDRKDKQQDKNSTNSTNNSIQEIEKQSQ